MLDFASYAVRIPRAELPRLPQILRDIPAEKVASMQHAMSRVWERFTYSSLVLAERGRRCSPGPLQDDRACSALDAEYGLGPHGAPMGPDRVRGYDAVHTLMMVLKARLVAEVQEAAPPPFTGR